MIQLIDVLAGLKALADDSVDIIICDPPYNIRKDFGKNKDDLTLGEYVNWCDQWLDQCERVLKRTGTLYVYGFAEILAHLAVRLPFPLECRWLVWHYTNKAVPSLKFWQRSHESILCCWKHTDRIFNTDDVRVPYTDTFLKNAAGKVRKGTKGRYSHEGRETVYEANEGGALPRDVIGVPALAGGAGRAERWFLCKDCDNVYPNKELVNHVEHSVVHHPTQKPYRLTEQLLKAARPKAGGLVVVPFAGTGSECAVARDMGMECVGFDNNPDYVKLANKFLEKKHDERRGETGIPIG